LSDSLGDAFDTARLLLAAEVYFIDQRFHLDSAGRDRSDHSGYLIEPRVAFFRSGDRFLN
jgi:hypothetical protein